jgi:hypothetical protein
VIVDEKPSFVRQLLAARRRSRANFLLGKVLINSPMKVVDIGCGIDGRSFSDFVPENWDVTGVDVLPSEAVHHAHPRFTYLQQDAQDLSRFDDTAFDLAVSIGVLEHITDELQLGRVVSEIRRIATQYAVVVPYRYCWIEPHYGVPFFPVLPRPVQAAIVRTLNLNRHRDAVKRDPRFIQKYYHWPSNGQYQALFPEAAIHLLPTREMIAIVRSARNGAHQPAADPRGEDHDHHPRQHPPLHRG